MKGFASKLGVTCCLYNPDTEDAKHVKLNPLVWTYVCRRTYRPRRGVRLDALLNAAFKTAQMQTLQQPFEGG